MNIRNLDLNLLKTLHVLLEERNVSKTADRLALSQSAVSHALGRLRKFFNDPLLIKIQNGMTPTAFAQELNTPLNRVMENIRELTGEDTFDPAVEKATFRIAASDYGAGIILPRLIERMAVLAPRCTIKCHPISAHLQHDLKLGVVDLAFGGYRPFENFSFQQLFHDRLIGVVRSGHPILSKEITKKQIKKWPHAYIDVTDSIKDKEKLYRSLGINPDTDIIARQPYFLVAPLIVEKSDLILMMPMMGAKVMGKIINVAMFELPTRIRPFPFIQLWHKRRDNDKMHKWLRDQILDICGDIDDFLKKVPGKS